MSLLKKAFISLGLVALAAVGINVLGQARSAPAPKTVSAIASQSSDKIVATVNGQPIHESELLAAMPEDAFDLQLEEMKRSKLERLVDSAIRAQFLRDHGVSVSEKEIDHGMQEFRSMVMTPGCPCCGGGYASLEQYMKVNSYAMPELRRRVANDIGIKLYLDGLTKEMIAPQALADAVKKHRAEVEADYVKGATITFDFYQDPGYLRDHAPVEARKEKLAHEAWQRLQKGDPFADVAKDMSEDKASAPQGGQLGCVRADYLGPEVEEAWRKLKPGTYSGPIKTPWGYRIVGREKLSDDDILSVIKEQARSLAEDQVYQEFKAAKEGAKIRIGPDAALSSTVPAPASPSDRKS